MTAGRVTKTAQAALDLDEIWFQIAPDNIAAADRLLDTVEQSCRRLAQQPLMGRARPELAPGLRSIPVARYMIFYAPTPDGIALVRVLHGARDIGVHDFEEDDSD